MKQSTKNTLKGSAMILGGIVFLGLFFWLVHSLGKEQEKARFNKQIGYMQETLQVGMKSARTRALRDVTYDGKTYTVASGVQDTVFLRRENGYDLVENADTIKGVRATLSKLETE
jgi:hypothetical protein